jgi:chromosomal replication initiation ATPase DnaA
MKVETKQMSVHYRIMELFGNKKPLTQSFEKVKELIAEYDLARNCRKREIVYRRSLLCWYLCNNTRMTLSEIGQMFGKDHSSIIHARKTIDDFIKFRNKDFNVVVYDIDSELRNIFKVTPNI